MFSFSFIERKREINSFKGKCANFSLFIKVYDFTLFQEQSFSFKGNLMFRSYFKEREIAFPFKENVLYLHELQYIPKEQQP